MQGNQSRTCFIQCIAVAQNLEAHPWLSHWKPDHVFGGNCALKTHLPCSSRRTPGGGWYPQAASLSDMRLTCLQAGKRRLGGAEKLEKQLVAARMKSWVGTHQFPHISDWEMLCFPVWWEHWVWEMMCLIFSSHFWKVLSSVDPIWYAHMHRWACGTSA